MSLASFFESIPEKQRNLQLGLECDNPMSGAFPHKRVVHAGLNGTLVSPKETQAVWDSICRDKYLYSFFAKYFTLMNS